MCHRNGFESQAWKLLQTLREPPNFSPAHEHTENICQAPLNLNGRITKFWLMAYEQEYHVATLKNLSGKSHSLGLLFHLAFIHFLPGINM